MVQVIGVGGRIMPASSSDRNLLIGILALQMDFITRDQLVTGMANWVIDKSKALDEVLLDNKAIDAPTRDLLLALVNKHLEVHQGDPQQSLAALSSVDSSLRDELRSISDSHITATLPILGSGRTGESSASDAELSTTIGLGAPSSELRFRILRPHAKGGLGQVFVAFDKELHREVALKEIQDQHADAPEARARFSMEAEITGRLEHPGIVPVYGLGVYANGRPFYVMRLIKGDSLKEAADHFHRTEIGASKRAYEGFEFRQLLGRYIDVCNAIEYAHSRGVLHRDLKPGNIMLGAYRETLVVDWGLAKVIGRAEGRRSAEESTLAPSSGGSSTPTVVGSALGTPAFMSPEQAAGRWDELGPGADVYSLGATLYFLLTGQAPFQSDSSDADLGGLLRKVQRGEFPHPRALNNTIPAALEAICLQAMANRPADRYSSASALANDVERWLADEPVAAFTETALARAGRFGRKHRGLVRTAIAALFAISLISTVGAVIIDAQRRENAGQALRKGDFAREKSDSFSAAQIAK
jgi:serine/threonine-protein kinase